MKFTITIDCDGEAFQGAPLAEVAAILEAQAARIKRFGDDFGDVGWSDTLIDSKGCRVGRAELSDYIPPNTLVSDFKPTAMKTSSPQFPPLESVTRPAVGTAAAAYYLNRSPHTLLIWSCYESGPLRPMRINGRLAWPVSDIRRVLGVPA